MVNLILNQYLSSGYQKSLPPTILNVSRNVYKPYIVTLNQKQDFITAQNNRNNAKFQKVYPLSIYDRREVLRMLTNGWGK